MDFFGCSGPSWFSIIEIIIQLLFVTVTFLIASTSYRIYRICKQKTTLLYGLGFLGVGIGYLMQAVLHLFLLINISSKDILSLAPIEAAKNSAIQLSTIPTVLGMTATTIGLALIAFVALKQKDSKVLGIFIILGLIGITTPLYHIIYPLIASVFLGFITLQYYKLHEQRKTTQSMIVYSGFGFILLGMLLHTLAKYSSAFYISGHIVALAGFVLLLWSLIKVVKKR
ncbi:MAG: hypothetical protein ACQESC_03685 [Nanobdellota archaeon]